MASLITKMFKTILISHTLLAVTLLLYVILYNVFKNNISTIDVKINLDNVYVNNTFLWMFLIFIFCICIVNTILITKKIPTNKKFIMILLGTLYSISGIIWILHYSIENPLGFNRNQAIFNGIFNAVITILLTIILGLYNICLIALKRIDYGYYLY